MQRVGLGLVTALLLTASTSWGASLKCGIGNDFAKLEYVRTARFSRGDKQVTLRFEDSNKYGIKYYQVKVYLDYKAEGDVGKDVVELILSPTVGYTAISSQKVSTLEGEEAFTLYLVKSSTSYIQLLCGVR